MKRKIIIPVLLVIALIIGAWLYFRNPGTRIPGGIKVSGNIEITDVAVSFKIPGRVEQRLVSEGGMVKTGQVIARLDDRDLSEEVAQRKAQVAAAEAVLAELKTGSRPEEIAQAEAVLERAQADGERARTEWERQKKLYEREVISSREYEVAKTTYDGTLARIREAREALNLVRKGPRQEKIDQARANLEQNRQALALAETRKGYAVLFSPLAGIVLSDNIEPGEYVSPGTPVLTLGDLTHLYLRAYINETDLGRVKLGQRVRVTTDTFPNKGYEGTITFIASQAEFTPKNVQTQKERVKLVYRIKVDIPNPNMELKPGMPADGEILITP
jgi:HlyD family secretion protein